MTKEELLKRVEDNHKHHPPKTDERILEHERIREATRFCAANLIQFCPVGRELSLALTKLEEAMFWANAAVARNED